LITAVYILIPKWDPHTCI